MIQFLVNFLFLKLKLIKRIINMQLN